MEFVLVPKGKSWLGGGGGKPGVAAMNKFVKTQKVEIAHDFYLGKYEVTQEEWQKVMGNNPSSHQLVPGASTADVKRFPVETVSWEDAQRFLKALNEKVKETGWLYRLPKALEWEYACRGGPMTEKDGPSYSAFDFYLENPTIQLLPEQANFNQVLKRTCKVGSYRPNRLGLYDMHGNVWEWCEDEFPQLKGAPWWMARGGSWGNEAGNCKAAYLVLYPPSFRTGDLGLRVARVPVGKEIVKVPAERPRGNQQPLQVIDLIQLYQDSDRIPVKNYTVQNKWTNAAGKLTYTSDGRSGKVMVPVSLKDVRDYEIDVSVQRLSGKGVFTIDLLASATRQTGLDIVIGGRIEMMLEDGRRVPIGAWPTPAKEAGHIVVRVRSDPKGRDGAVSVSVDGKTAAQWKGDWTRIGKPIEFHPKYPGAQVPGIFCYKDSFEFSSWKLLVYEGRADILRRVASQLTPAFKNSLGMDWTPFFKGKGLTGWLAYHAGNEDQPRTVTDASGSDNARRRRFRPG
jgi:formylglycine-generating enzyme required for sulfatase activity